MRILVTGGAGFIGSFLTERLLAEGHAVDVVDDLSSGSLANLAEARRVGGRALRMHHIDVRTAEAAELVRGRSPEVVYHLAAAAPEAGPVRRADVAVVGGLQVLEGAADAGTRKIVVVSDAAVYGRPDPRHLPLIEREPRQPVSVDGVAAHAVDAYLLVFRAERGLEFTSLVAPTVYGPRDRHGIVGRCASAVAAGEGAEPAAIAAAGRERAGSTLDLLFVDDVVDALARAATRGDGLILNIGSGVETPVDELEASIRRAAGSAGGKGASSPDGGRTADARPAYRCALDAARAASHLGWRPWTTLEDGLAAVLGSVSAVVE